MPDGNTEYEVQSFIEFHSVDSEECELEDVSLVDQWQKSSPENPRNHSDENQNCVTVASFDNELVKALSNSIQQFRWGNDLELSPLNKPMFCIRKKNMHDVFKW